MSNSRNNNFQDKSIFSKDYLSIVLPVSYYGRILLKSAVKHSLVCTSYRLSLNATSTFIDPQVL